MAQSPFDEGLLTLRPNPLTDSELSGAKRDATLANPDHPNLPYSNAQANTVQQPKSTAAGNKEKTEEEVEVARNKRAPIMSPASDLGVGDKSASGLPKKLGFMDKLKARSKILSGKISNNPNKTVETRT